jgi:hypothetical protein
MDRLTRSVVTVGSSFASLRSIDLLELRILAFYLSC